MASSGFRQEMPPSGGYGPIEWARKLGRQPMAGWKILSLLGVTTTFAWAHYYLRWKPQKTARELEMWDSRLALEPFLRAERERHLLRAIRRNRDAENELMKNHPEWITGTVLGEPVFHNLANRFHYGGHYELYMHTKEKEMLNRCNERFEH